jgi:hypothetical protein
MEIILTSKFENPIMKNLLLNTGGQELIEGNTWNDTFWDQCPIGNGDNNLGKLLMKIRNKLRVESFY